jgi:hypothetical protein
MIINNLKYNIIMQLKICILCKLQLHTFINTADQNSYIKLQLHIY